MVAIASLHAVEIVKRLAHAHENEIGDEARRVLLRCRALGAGHAGPFAEAVARDHDLRDDLRSVQIAHQPLRAGVAERAIQRAADLRGNAERAAVAFGNVNRFDVVRLFSGRVGGKANEPLARAVGRYLFDHDFGAIEREHFAKLGAQSFRDIRHRVEVACAAEVNPVPELRDAHLALAFRHAGFAERFGELRAIQSCERAFHEHSFATRSRACDRPVSE
jgi:hypothetical protein